MRNDKKELEERRTWLSNLMQYVKPGRIVEFGCGSGFVLEILSNEFEDSIILGLDVSMERLGNVIEKDLANVIPVKGDVTQKIFVDKTFDTAFFVASLHEVFSNQGRGKVEDALKIANEVLKDDGILMIHDFLRPSPRPVEIGFKNEETEKIFLRFAKEFRPRNVKFEKTERGAILDIGDAVEFISKYDSPSEEDWIEEMGESHFFFTEKDYRDTTRRAGFTVKHSRTIPRGEERWLKSREHIEFGFEPEYAFIQLVLNKS